MKKLIISSIFLLSILHANAQLEKALLWEISGNGITKPSYLYGTMHQICKEKVAISTEFREIIKNMDEVYLEINFDELHNDFKNHFDYFNKSGKQLSSYFSNEQYQKLEKVFNRQYRPYKITLSQFANHKPNKILGNLLPQIINCQFTSYENEISRIALKAQKKVLGIETYEEHFAFINDSDSLITAKAQQFYELITTKEPQTEAIAESNKITQMYLDKDIEAMYKYSDDLQDDEEKYQILDERNKLWIPRIAKISREKQALYAVGAAHLAGENGVISLLRKEGFVLKPIF